MNRKKINDDMIRVYIASPYTKGDVAVNVKTQMDIANELIELGYAPFVPLYSHFQHMAHPRPYEDWIALDLEWLKTCHALIRLPGESLGADNEVKFAEELCLDVFDNVSEMDDYYQSILDMC